MVRGTTPTLTLTVGTAETVDLEQATAVYVTVSRLGAVITKTGADLSIDGNVVECWLTEEESLQLREGPASIQVNWTYGSSKRAASKVAAVNIGRQLLLEEVTA